MQMLWGPGSGVAFDGYSRVSAGRWRARPGYSSLGVTPVDSYATELRAMQNSGRCASQCLWVFLISEAIKVFNIQCILSIMFVDGSPFVVSGSTSHRWL